MIKKIVFAIIIILGGNRCTAQQPQIIKWSTLQEILDNKVDSTFVVNFWATWCKPCVTELPYFIETEKRMAEQLVKFYYISLDFKRDFSTRLLPFLQNENITSAVYLLDEPDYNSWINKVDSNWGGAIPATLIFNNSKGIHDFYEKEFAHGELEQTLKTYIK